MPEISKSSSSAAVEKRIREGGERANAEAAARRAKDAEKTPQPKEIGGQKGPDPTRYGDWEKNGIASDF